MAIRKTEYTAGPESIPKRARFGFRISRSYELFKMPWQVEVWGKPPQVYVKVESQTLVDALKMMVIARFYKPKAKT